MRARGCGGGPPSLAPQVLARGRDGQGDPRRRGQGRAAPGRPRKGRGGRGLTSRGGPSGLVGRARPEEAGTDSGPRGLPGARSLGNRAGPAERQAGARAAEPQVAAGQRRGAEARQRASGGRGRGFALLPGIPADAWQVGARARGSVLRLGGRPRSPPAWPGLCGLPA